MQAALRYAQKQETEKGTQRFQKLIGQHIVFVVDECHRALSAEGMEGIKGFFPNSTWFGFTGTPIFNENKKQGQGQLARTTRDQYGEVLHTYTIKNALEDGSVLGFQVEHEDTIEPVSLYNHIFSNLRADAKHADRTDEEIGTLIEEMDEMTKEAYIPNDLYEREAHIEKVLQKMLRPDNVYTKFDFKNGRPQKSAILTTSSIAMAKRYYHAIRGMKQDPDWMETHFAGHPLRKGRTIDDPDFPRIAITYSMQENTENAAEVQEEMRQVIREYNEYYGTAWTLEDIERYNGDINNRLARKKAEFKQFGKQIDLVIVVDRLLTGFDAPTIQTLFVDRNLSYANLIQAFSRTNRTYPDKTKGLVVTFRRPATMEENVRAATRLYSNENEDTSLIYPTYDESKKRFKKGYKVLKDIVPSPDVIDEHSPIDERVEFVKAYQEFNRVFEALATYDEYNDDMEKSKALVDQVQVLTDFAGIYETVKGSLIEDEDDSDEERIDYSEIEFYAENSIKLYDIDSTYINQLLGTYSANSEDIRSEIEKALQKLGKSEIVKTVYHTILDAIDNEVVSPDEDIFGVKRRYFKQAYQEKIETFALEWCVDEQELYTSAVQYHIGMEKIPNVGRIIESKDFARYKETHPDAILLKYGPGMKRSWRIVLDEEIIPLDQELR